MNIMFYILSKNGYTNLNTSVIVFVIYLTPSMQTVDYNCLIAYSANIC